MAADSAHPLPGPPTDLPLNERGQAFEDLLRERILRGHRDRSADAHQADNQLFHVNALQV